MTGGVTETSTERRVIFSPEIEGPRVAEAWPEWRIFTELAARVRPDLADRLRYDGTASIRADIARAVPAYAGIEKLSGFGDQFQVGGPHLCAGWEFPTPGGKARFSAVSPPALDRPDGSYIVGTRRGKQFNSMVYERTDPLNGAVREAVLMNPGDADRHGFADGDPVVLTSDFGELRGKVLRAPVAPGSLQVHWPEGEVLYGHATRSPGAGIPDYKSTAVFVERAPAGESSTTPAPLPEPAP
jgi:anaerobic selenocysteine-containing dehydrogenase